MPSYDQDLLETSRLLLRRKTGQRGRLSGARVRRSVSTTYYAIFHFMLDEVGRRIVGTANDHRVRRRTLIRTISHAGAKRAFDKVRGVNADPSIADLLRLGTGQGPVQVPRYIRDLAGAFIDAYSKREDADYDLNAALSEADARLLRLRVRRAIKGWRGATARSDNDLKKALCALILVKGQLRPDR